MSANPWSKFFWNDWETDPALKLCSLAAQGLWMRMLCIAAKSQPIGYVKVGAVACSPEDIASLAGRPVDEVKTLLEELKVRGVHGVDRHGCIYSRRLVRDAKKSKTNAKNGKNGGAVTYGKQKGIFQSPRNDTEPPTKRRSKPHKPESISQSPEKRDSSESLLPESSTAEPILVLIGDPDQNKPVKPDLTAEFVAWYAQYPRREDRIAAEKAYRTARKTATAADLLGGAMAYAADCDREGRERRFIKTPARWLNAGAWTNESQAMTNGGNFERPDDRTGRRTSAHGTMLAAFDLASASGRGQGGE